MLLLGIAYACGLKPKETLNSLFFWLIVNRLEVVESSTAPQIYHQLNALTIEKGHRGSIHNRYW